MEDIRIGRKSDVQCKSFVAPVNALVAPANVNRIRLSFATSAQVACQVYFFPRRLTTAASFGAVTLTLEHPSHTITVEEWGSAMFDDWFCTDNTGTQTVVVTDVSLGDK